MARKQEYIFAKKKQSYLKEMIVIILLVAAIVLIALFLFFNLFGAATRVTVKDQNTVELGSQAKASDLIGEIKNGTLKQDAVIDTSRVGTTRVEVVLDNDGVEKTFSFDVEVVDTTPPTIGVNDSFNILMGGTIDIAAQAQVADNSGGDVTLDVAGNLNPNAAGSYPITLTATDPSGNTTTKDVTVNIIDMAIADGNITFTTKNGFKGERVDGVTTIDDIIIVNKTFSLPEDYGPWDLTQEAATAYYNLINAAWDEHNYEIYSISSFRSYWDQQNIYEGNVWNYGYAYAEAHSIRPGHSEHQAGLACDINWQDEEFAETDEGKWLNDNCYKFGFIMRYPKGSEESTGYQYEPWHIRYVGEELAERLYNGGNWITLEEYFGIPSTYSVNNRSDYEGAPD